MREERAYPIRSRRRGSPVAQLLAGTVSHEPALTGRILAYCGIDLKHCPSNILNVVAPMSIYGSDNIDNTPAPAWWRAVERLPYEDRVDHAAFRAHYGKINGHPRLFVLHQ